MSDNESKTTKPDKDLSPDELLKKALAMGEDDILPWEDVALPSKGFYYDDKLPDGIVQVRPMNIHAEKMMATQRFARSGKAIDMMFRQCVKLPGDELDTLELLAGDRIFLLYYIRGITHGPVYEFMLTCPNEDCQDTSTYEYDLVELYNTVKEPKYELGKEPFKIVLPHMSKILEQEFWVKVRFLRGSDMQNMMRKRNIDKKVAGGRARNPNHRLDNADQTLEDNINMVVTEVMGDTSKLKIGQVVSKLHSLDTATIREFIRDNAPGIDTSIMINCVGCNREYSIDLPITESFFRPSDPGRNGERVGSSDGAGVHSS